MGGGSSYPNRAPDECTGIKAADTATVHVGGDVKAKMIASEQGGICRAVDAESKAKVTVTQDTRAVHIRGETAVKEYYRIKLEKYGWQDTLEDLRAGKRATEPYKLKGKCGALIICNHFDDRKNPSEAYHEKKREGADLDVRALKALFENSLKCILFPIKENVEGREVQKILENFRKYLMDNNCDSCIVVIMSHGGEKAHSILMDDLKEINLFRDFVYPFSHKDFPGFKGKPKIFLVQACQDYGDKEDSKGFIPSHDEIQDVIIGYATIPYQTAQRGDNYGSIFIQSVIKIFRENADKHDLADMLQLVHDDVLDSTKNAKVEVKSSTGETKMVSGQQITHLVNIGFKRYVFNL